LELRFKEHIHYITTNNPQSTYALHILYNAHEYGPVEITTTLLHSTHNRKWMNTLENYYIQFFHQHNMSINEQNQKEGGGGRPLFWYTTAMCMCV